MESLNNIVQRSVEANKMLFECKGITVKLDFDPDMPEIYDGFTVGTPLNNALSQLNAEIDDANPTKTLYRTSFESGVQKLKILHNGKAIPQDDLGYLNRILDGIYEGWIQWPPCWRHGNLIAGQAIKAYGGRIRLENIDEDGYKVRTTMEIPVRIL
jgi:hypothetical protein